MSSCHNPTVSVIIPTFNRARTIGRAIQSVLAQTIQEFEIIVVDDGSTDDTESTVKGVGDPRIVYLRHDQNKMAAAARNTGINAARGAYLAFLDSDDEWFPEKLAEQLTLLHDPTQHCDVSCSAFVVKDGGIERPYVQQPASSWFQRLQWDCDLSPGTTLMVRRECVSRVGMLDETFPVFEDWDWLLRLSRDYNVAVVAKPLARVYRSRPPSAEIVEASTRRFVSKHSDAFRSSGWLYRHRVIARHWLRLAACFYSERQFFRGNWFLLKAVLDNPFQYAAVFVFAVPLSLADRYLGTSFVAWTLTQKRRWEIRKRSLLST